LAIEAARSATTVPEQRQNAWYNLAIVAAARDDPATVESSLRSAISAGPRWFKPHWALARLLYSAGRVEEARREANLALDLDGRRDPEVVATTAEIVRSLDSRR
jgi:Flp pilus assembly protein TadD